MELENNLSELIGILDAKDGWVRENPTTISLELGPYFFSIQSMRKVNLSALSECGTNFIFCISKECNQVFRDVLREEESYCYAVVKSLFLSKISPPDNSTASLIKEVIEGIS